VPPPGPGLSVPTVPCDSSTSSERGKPLSNPYTGVLAIFGSRLLNDRAPVVFEDGLQQRDFVNVLDVARACRLAIESDRADGLALNIGSGCVTTVLEVARLMARALGKSHIEPQVNGKYRVGDIRHCFADISLAREILDFEPHLPLEVAISDLAEWLREQTATDEVEKASAELAARGLTV